jgi:hypothetical protein
MKIYSYGMRSSKGKLYAELSLKAAVFKVGSDGYTAYFAER